MPLVIADRVRETTTTSGTGTISLAGPYSGFQAFSVIGNGNTTYYAIIDAQNGAWEVGIGAYTTSGNTLSRATVLASSNAGSLVNFGTGTKDVILTQPARRSVLVQEGGSGLITGVAAFTANGVPYADSTSTLATSANMVFNGTRLTVADLADSGLTSGRVTYASTGGALVDSANLTFDGTNLTLGGGTANGVAYLNGSKVLTTGSALTFDGTNLGVGVAGSAPLSFANSTGQKIRFYNALTGYGIGVENSEFRFVTDNGAVFTWGIGSYASPSEQMRLTSTGLGIGTSSPNAKLAVVGGGIRVNGYSNNSAGDGVNIQLGTTGGVNYLQSLNGTGTNNLSIDANQVTFRTGSYTTAATLDSSGNLGLGVTPSAWSGISGSAFEIKGNAYIASTTQVLSLATNCFFNGTNWIYKSTNPANRYDTFAGQHLWYNAPSGTAGNAITFTQAMTLDASGNLLVGQTSGSNRLAVTTSGTSLASFTGAEYSQINIIGGSQNFYIQNYNSVSIIGTKGASPLVITTNETERARIDSSGNFLVGTTTAGSLASSGRGLIEVNGSSDSAFAMEANGTMYGYLYNSPSEFRIANITANPVTFFTNNTERARIDSSGNLLVGLTSAIVADGKFQARNSSISQATGYFQNATTTGNAIFASFGTEASYTERGSISYNRAAGLTSYNTTSDYRAKDISGPVVNSGALIDSVPVYMGKMKGATQERPMFIAHETPDYAHTGEKDAVDADGNPVYQQMDASALIPVMWAEIQSLRARLAAANI